MTTPKHTRPFNLEHARAGAPFARADGIEYEIVKWDRKHTQQLVGVSKQDAGIHTWRADGSPPAGGPEKHLVMTPLGFIDGKPVFVGDYYLLASVIGPADTTAVAHAADRNFTGCAWPAPARVYPESQMTNLQINTAIVTDNNQLVSHGETESGRRVANAALRHAVVGGYLVLPSIHYAVQHELKMLKSDRAGSETAAKCPDTTPDSKYPETTMHDTEIVLAANSIQTRRLTVQLRHVINIALRHAVDEGLVVLPGKDIDDDVIFKALRRVQENHGAVLINDLVVRDTVRALLVTEPEIDALKADLARNSRELGKAERALEEVGYRMVDGEWRQVDGTHFFGVVNSFQVTGTESAIAVVKELCTRSAERDMAIAEAVRAACTRACEPIGGFPQMKRALGAVDIHAIIARVAP